jgi:hypothetical protein
MSLSLNPQNKLTGTIIAVHDSVAGVILRHLHDLPFTGGVRRVFSHLLLELKIGIHLRHLLV